MDVTSSSSDSDNEDDIVSPSSACCMHVVPHGKGQVSFFHEKSWSKFKDCCVRWSRVESAETKIAIRAAEKFGIDLHGHEPHRQQDQDHHESLPSFPTQASYQRRCYQHFCNVGKLARAEIRMEKRKAEGRFNLNFRF